MLKYCTVLWYGTAYRHESGVILYRAIELQYSTPVLPVIILIRVLIPEKALIAPVTGTTLYGHTYSKSKDQPGKVASPAHGQLNREN